MTTHFLLYYSTCKNNDIRSIQKESCNSLYDRKEYMPSAKSIIAIERPRHNRLNLQKKIIDRCCNPKNHTHTHRITRVLCTHTQDAQMYTTRITHIVTQIFKHRLTRTVRYAHAHTTPENESHTATHEKREVIARAPTRSNENHTRAQQKQR